MGRRIKTRIQAAVLYGDLFSSTIIIATGIAVIKKTSEKMGQKFSPLFILVFCKAYIKMMIIFRS